MPHRHQRPCGQQGSRTGMMKSSKSAPACRRVLTLAAALTASSATSLLKGAPVVVTMRSAVASGRAGARADLQQGFRKCLERVSASSARAGCLSLVAIMQMPADYHEMQGAPDSKISATHLFPDLSPYPGMASACIQAHMPEPDARKVQPRVGYLARAHAN